MATCGDDGTPWLWCPMQEGGLIIGLRWGRGVVGDELDWSMTDDDDSKKPAWLQNVMVATCGDDSTARLWYPLLVCDLILRLKFF